MLAFISRERGRVSTPMSVLLGMLKLGVGRRVLADLILQQQDVVHRLSQDGCFRVCILGAPSCDKRENEPSRETGRCQIFVVFFVLKKTNFINCGTHFVDQKKTVMCAGSTNKIKGLTLAQHS